MSYLPSYGGEIFGDHVRRRGGAQIVVPHLSPCQQYEVYFDGKEMFNTIKQVIALNTLCYILLDVAITIFVILLLYICMIK